MPDRLPMAFKGGTALSKVYGVIERFSEDIDITLDYRVFAGEVGEDQSRSSIKKLSDQLKEFVRKHAEQVVRSHFVQLLNEQFPEQATRVSVSENRQALENGVVFSASAPAEPNKAVEDALFTRRIPCQAEMG